LNAQNMSSDKDKSQDKLLNITQLQHRDPVAHASDTATTASKGEAMAIVGKDRRSNSCSRSPPTDVQNPQQSPSKSERDGASLSSSHDSKDSLQNRGNTDQEDRKETKSKSKPVPSSPMVTPPMGSNASPESPRVRVEGGPKTALPPAVAAHGFHANPTVDYAGRQPPLPPSQAAVKQVEPRPSGAAVVVSSSCRNPSSPQHKPRGVPHVYHDYSQVSGPGASFVRKKTGGVTNPFPEKLHEMLDQESSDDPSSAIVSWLPHGRAFIVRRPKEFTSQIMPRYFRQTKLTSFQRQLNLYGFRRITQGADSGAYYHELFLQGRPLLSQRMVRQKVKGTGHKQPADVSSEPNFYSMPQVRPEHPGETFGAKYKATIMPPTSQPAIAFGQAVPPSGTHAPTGQSAVLLSTRSPGYGSLQGAASLLQGFASSFGGTGGATHLGPGVAMAAAEANKATQEASKQDKKHSAAQKPASFLPTGDG